MMRNAALIEALDVWHNLSVPWRITSEARG